MRYVFFALLISFSLNTNALTHLDYAEAYTVYGSYRADEKLATTVFIGKAHGVYGDQFIARLEQHIALVKKLMLPQGLVSYTVYATEDHELAVMQWPNNQAMERAFSQVGPTISQDANQFLKTIIWQKLTPLPDELDNAFFETALNTDLLTPAILSCTGLNPDYPNATIFQRGENYLVSMAYDLDVPGGASGYTSWKAHGIINKNEIRLTGENQQEIIGTRKDGQYLLSIQEGNIAIQFKCKLIK